MEVLPQAGSIFGSRVRQRLRDEVVVWLTTVGSDGTPQPNPVWFLWVEPSAFLVYNRIDARRLVHIAARPRVAMHFDGNGRGGDIMVFTGRAEVVDDQPPADEHEEYLAKYREHMVRVSGSAREFAEAYPVPVLVHVERMRGF